MKKIAEIMTVLLLCFVTGCNFLYVDDTIMEKVMKDYGEIANLVIPEGEEEQVKDSFETLAREYHISFAKVVREPKNNIKDRESWAVFATDREDIEESILKCLTKNKIEARDYDKLAPSELNGDYFFKGEDIYSFLEELEQSNPNITVERIFNSPFVGNFSYSEFFLASGLLVVIGMATIFTLILYNSTISRQLATSMLLGWKKRDFVVTYTTKVLYLPFTVAFLLVNTAIYWMVRPRDICAFVISMSGIYKMFFLLCIIIAFMEILILFFMVNQMSVLSCLKGYKKTYTKSTTLVKIVSLAITAYLIAVSSMASIDYLEMRPFLKAWENAKNYSNIGVTCSEAYINNNEKFNQVVMPSLNKLWDRLDEEGALLFDAPFTRHGYTEEIGEDESDISYRKSRAFEGKVAFVNKNYIKHFGIVDSEGKALEDLQLEDGCWGVLVPESMEIRDVDREQIKEIHGRSAIEGYDKGEIYKYIRGNQRLISLAARKRIEDSFIDDYALIVVDGTMLDPENSFKISSLINGSFHPFTNNWSKPYEELKNIIEETKAKPYIVNVESTYSIVEHRIDYYKMQALVYIAALILSLVMLFIILGIDVKSYFISEGKRIDVSAFLGHSSRDIHSKKLVASLIGYIFSIGIVASFIYVAADLGLGFYSPIEYWTYGKLLIASLIALVSAIFAILIEIYLIIAESRKLILRIKEGN